MSSRHTAERASSTVISTPDANNATYFLPGKYSWNSPYWLSNSDFCHNNKENYYKYLKKLNEGKKNGPSWHNDKYHTSKDNKHLIDTLTGQLDLTIPQREAADSYFHSFDLQEWGSRKEMVAYALCAYVVKSDEQNEARRTHPNVPEDKRDSLFVEMADSLNITHREFVTTYGKVQAKVSEYALPPKPDRPDGAGPDVGGT